ncbi:MAG: PAS domain-containing protein [Chloroflexi bacterium]|nr:PAS domain-containing protein [Chloroflexota bacterium]
MAGLLAQTLEREQVGIAPLAIWRYVARQTGDALYVADAEGRPIDVNEETERMAGAPIVLELSAAETLEQYPLFRPDGTPVGPDDAATLRVLRDGEPVRNEELVIIRPNGEQLSTIWSTVPRLDAAGQRIGAISVGRDITLLRTAQRALERKVRELEGLRDISQLGSSAANSTEFYNALAERVAKVLHADSCSILRWDEESRVFRPIVTFGVPTPATRIGDPVEGETNTIWAEIFGGRTVQVTADDDDERIVRLSAYFKGLGLDGILTTRLAADGQGIGLLSVGRRWPAKRFNDEEVRLTEIIAGQVAREVESYRLRRALEREGKARDAVLNQLPQGVVVFGISGRIVFMNRVAHTIYDGLGDVNDHWSDVERKMRERGITGGLAADNFLMLRRALEEGVEVVGQTLTVAGGERPDRHYELSCVPVRISGGRISGAVVMFQNVTEAVNQQRDIQQMLEEIEESDGRFRAMVQMMNAAVLLVDEESILYANPQYLEMFDLPPDLVGRPRKDVIPLIGRCFAESEEYVKAIQAVQDMRQETFHMELEQIYPEHRYLERISSPIPGGNGEYFGRIIVFRDVTRHKQMIMARDRFLDTTARALWEPMGLARGGLALLARDFDSVETAAAQGENVAERLRQFQQRVMTLDNDMVHLIQVAETMRELSRRQEGRLHISKEPLDFAAAVRTAMGRLDAEVRGRINLDGTAGGPYVVEGDGPRLETIVRWLMENAAVYSSVTRSTVRVRMSRPGPDRVRLEVADRGMGLAPGEHEQIFTCYFRSTRALQLQPRGLGVSLFLAQEIVRQHEGQLWAESAGIDRGTRFILELPLA